MKWTVWKRSPVTADWKHFRGLQAHSCSSYLLKVAFLSTTFILCCGARLKQRFPRTFTCLMLQEEAWQPCRLAGLETQALALLAGVTLQELYCVGMSTPMEVVQVNLKSCSIFPEYQALGQVRLAGFEHLLCTGESMNLKIPAASMAFTASEQQVWSYRSWKHLWPWAAHSFYIKNKVLALGMAGGTPHLSIAPRIVGNFASLTFWA